MYRLRELRKNHGLSLAQLSDKLNSRGLSISSDSLSKYERGEREPKLKTWQKLADFFNVSVEYPMGLSDTPNTEPKWDFSKPYKDPPAHGLSGMADDNNLPLTISSQSLFSMLYMIYSNRASDNPDAKFADTNEKIRELNKPQKEQVIKSFISWFENEVDRSKDID